MYYISCHTFDRNSEYLSASSNYHSRNDPYTRHSTAGTSSHQYRPKTHCRRGSSYSRFHSHISSPNSNHTDRRNTAGKRYTVSRVCTYLSTSVLAAQRARCCDRSQSHCHFCKDTRSSPLQASHQRTPEVGTTVQYRVHPCRIQVTYRVQMTYRVQVACQP